MNFNRQLLADCPKDIICLSGMGRIYLNEWWKLHVRDKSPWNEWNEKNKSVFIHVPKTAGMSVYKALNMPLPRETHCPAVGYRSADREGWENAMSFAFVRNPWDRFVSAYHYLKHSPISDDDVRWSEQNLSKYSDFQEFSLALSNPFFRARVLMWRHFTPQWYYLCDERGRLMVSHVMKFENFDNEINGVGNKLKIDVRSAKENVVKRNTFDEYYNEGLARLVGKMYSKDVDLFKYKFDLNDHAKKM